jgi:hypothetical protein
MKNAGPAPGDILGERYVLKHSEWQTPLGPVWLARDRVLDRAVLVQFLSQTLAADASTRRAFQKAAARIAQIGGPGLLQVYDIGDVPAFAVLEHASGGRLAERLDAGPMRPTDAARASLAIARGLESLHDRGSWHGSLSPATVLFDEEGRAKIFAVGAADTARAATKVKLDADQPAGYRTPEKDPIPADADRYALAALTYQMLTGSPPEKGLSARAKRRGVPQQIDALLTRSLAADPKVRPSLDEFEAALAPFARVIPSDVKEPRFAIAEFRWLVPVIVVIALAVAAITFGGECHPYQERARLRSLAREWFRESGPGPEHIRRRCCKHVVDDGLCNGRCRGEKRSRPCVRPRTGGDDRADPTADFFAGLASRHQSGGPDGFRCPRLPAGHECRCRLGSDDRDATDGNESAVRPTLDNHLNLE